MVCSWGMSRTEREGWCCSVSVLKFSECCIISGDRRWNSNSKFLTEFAKTVSRFLLPTCFIVWGHREGQVTLPSGVCWGGAAFGFQGREVVRPFTFSDQLWHTQLRLRWNSGVFFCLFCVYSRGSCQAQLRREGDQHRECSGFTAGQALADCAGRFV